MGDLDDDALLLVKRRRKVPMKQSMDGYANPDSAISNYKREVVHRSDDFTVAPASIMDSTLTFNIPRPTPA